MQVTCFSSHASHFVLNAMAPKAKHTNADGSTPRICIIGGGPAGLCAAVQLKRKLNLTSFVVFDKAADFGGVWLTTTYPGAQIDTPAFIYSYSFAQNRGWTKLYPDGAEMLAYFQGVARKYDIYRHAQFKTEVLSAVWKEETSTWSVTTVAVGDYGTRQQKVQEFDLVIVGTGPFRSPNYPETLATFTGPKMHSADWDSNVNLEGRIVGVVGGGPSAIQLIPRLAATAKELMVFMREPTHVAPKRQVELGRLRFRWFPALTPISRTLSLLVFGSLDSMFDAGSFTAKSFGALCSAYMRWNVKDEALRQKLATKFDYGFKTPVIGVATYFKTFSRPNVTLVRSPIQECVGSAITTEDGHIQSVDVIILCTGFKLLEFFAPMRIIGRNGVDLLQKWKSGSPATFYGVTCAEAPNLFFLLGPNGISPTLGEIVSIECQMRFIVSAVKGLMKRGASSVRVSPVAQAECMAEINEASRKKVYMQPPPTPKDGTSGSTGPRSENGFPLLWPKSNVAYWLRTRRLDPSKFEFTRNTQKASA